jgi:hypothetical protein
VGNPIARKAVEGWQISGVSRVQSGSPDRLTGRGSFNQNENGVVLYNLTTQELNDMVKIRKSTSPTSGIGLITFLPHRTAVRAG